MAEIYPAPGSSAHKLIAVADDIRRKCCKLISNAGQQKKFMGLSVRQASAVSQAKSLLEERPEGVSLKTLATHLQMTIPAASLLVETMVNKGFFERTPDPEDRRAVRIRFSQKGTDVFNEIFFRVQKEFDDVLQILTPEEQRCFNSICDKVYAGYFDTPRS